MFRFALKRLLEAIPLIFIIVTLSFFMVRLTPGGPFDQERELPEAVRKRLEAQYGLDAPLWQQYVNYLSNLLKGDLGASFKYPSWTVKEIIASKLPTSLELGFYALIVALITGIGLGTLAALRPNTLTDTIPMSFAMIGVCLPTFVLGPLLLLFLALNLEWFNVAGWLMPRDRILPALTLGLFYAAYIARLTRSSLLEVRNQEFIRTARAKGLSPWRVYCLHEFPNALQPVISYLGPAIAGLLSGSFVVETIFSIPGLGRFFIISALNRDVTLVMGTVIFYAVLIITLNLLIDIVLAMLNPKRAFE